ncbi:hypothetical protein [Streptomyces xantholiticus]|uniref:Uncharacterized protein n=1 Tax=Streptomyces xantholiticus TaxID=68285 RepID=A0ABV1UZW5_9ACTN
MPMRTMLPPNLTRHFYETRRLIAEEEGKTLAPWFRLSADQRAAVEMDVEVFRRSILRAEEEQDLVTSASAAATAEPAPAAGDSTTAEDCACPGCSVVAALLELLKRARRLEESMRPPVKTPNSFLFTIGEITTQAPGARPTPEETARVRKLAQDAIDAWVAAGKPLKVIEDPRLPGAVSWQLERTPSWLTPAHLDDRVQRRFDAARLDYFTRQARFPVQV